MCNCKALCTWCSLACVLCSCDCLREQTRYGSHWPVENEETHESWPKCDLSRGAKVGLAWPTAVEAQLPLNPQKEKGLQDDKPVGSWDCLLWSRTD